MSCPPCIRQVIGINPDFYSSFLKEPHPTRWLWSELTNSHQKARGAETDEAGKDPSPIRESLSQGTCLRTPLQPGLPPTTFSELSRLHFCVVQTTCQSRSGGWGGYLSPVKLLVNHEGPNSPQVGRQLRGLSIGFADRRSRFFHQQHMIF